MSNSTPDCYLSIKAPALKFDIDLVKKVLEEARRLNVEGRSKMNKEQLQRAVDRRK